MRLLKLLLLVACLYGAYHWWNGRTADTAKDMASPNGFVSVVMPDGAALNTVLILAAPNCPSDQSQHAEALAQDLTEQGIPVARGDSISFDIENPTAEQIAGADRAIAVFKEGAPAVFINGMAMSNPTAAQAAAEYRRTKASL